MILHYYLVRVLHQQRLEEAARKGPELRMIREVERGRRSRKGRLLRSVRRRLSRPLTNRPTLSARGCVPARRPESTYTSCMDNFPDELSCRAA